MIGIQEKLLLTSYHLYQLLTFNCLHLSISNQQNSCVYCQPFVAMNECTINLCRSKSQYEC